MVFYFSCTGNTRWAAKRIKYFTGDNIVDIAAECKKHGGSDKIHEYTLDSNEPIGFLFPIHGWRPPLMVREFISKLRITNAQGRYCYIICTAGDTVGEAVDIFQKDLAAIGLKADSAISLIMPESYIGLPFMNLDNESSEIHKKMQAHRILTQFIDSILDKQRGIFNITKGRWPRINSRLLGHAFVNWIIGDSKFRVDPDRCIHCGKCAKVCPTSDIECQNGETPVWKHNGKCLSCFACYHHCPTRAIEYGSRTKGKGQYYYEHYEHYEHSVYNAK